MKNFEFSMKDLAKVLDPRRAFVGFHEIFFFLLSEGKRKSRDIDTIE